MMRSPITARATSAFKPERDISLTPVRHTGASWHKPVQQALRARLVLQRSEERRVGKERRARRVRQARKEQREGAEPTVLTVRREPQVPPVPPARRERRVLRGKTHGATRPCTF